VLFCLTLFQVLIELIEHADYLVWNKPLLKTAYLHRQWYCCFLSGDTCKILIKMHFCSTQLCCEDDNFTVGRTLIEDDTVRNQTSSLIWTSYGVIVPIILTVGVFGNAAIFVVLSGPVFRGIAYLYLSGLALAHIGVILSWITISLYNSIFNNVHCRKKYLTEENRLLCSRSTNKLI